MNIYLSRITFYVILIILFGCEEVEEKELDKSLTETNKETYNPDIWPEPKPHEVQVMILGVYHMSNPNLDENNINADDVRSPKRQKELEELAELLKEFNPDVITTEVNYKRQARLDSLYKNSSIDTLLKNYTNEAIQIGFRLANKLNLDRIHAIDFPMRLGNDSLKVLYEKYNKNIPHKLSYPKLDWDQINKKSDSTLYHSTITEFLIEKNKEQTHRRNHYGMFADLRKGEKDNFGGAQNLARWYERNFKMVHNIYRAAKSDTRKILLIVGSGHVSPLRHILDDAPMFCPVSPIPYLKGNLD